MIGAIIGDIVGSRFEFANTTDKDFKLSYPSCDFTDDTICTIAIADAILHGYDFGESLLAWCRRYPNPKGSYGGSFSRWLTAANPQPYNSFGNGAAMRVSPVIWASLSLQEAQRMAMATAQPTHNHPEGIIGAMAIAEAGFLLRKFREQHANFLSVIDNLHSLASLYYGEDYADHLPAPGVFDETCMGCVPLALHIMQEAHGFEDAIRRAILHGGDSDTLGAIVGSLAEARWGIPHALEEEFLQYLPAEMLNVVQQFKSKYQ